MNIVSRFFTGMAGGLDGMVKGYKAAVLPGLMDEWIRIMGGGSGANTAGENITPRSAMAIAAFYSCVRVISEDVAKIALKFYKRNSDDSVVETPTFPLYHIFNEAANGWQSGFDMREMQTAYLLLRGNAYSLKVRSLAAGVLSDGKGQIVELVPILPDRVEIKRLTDGTPFFRIQPPSNSPGSPKDFTMDDIYFERGLTLDGYSGITPITYQAETLGFALAQTKYGGRLLGKGGRPGGILSVQGKLGDLARTRLREHWDATYGGNGAGGTAVLEEGATWTQLAMKNVDMQYVEAMKLTRQAIASLMRVPLHKIADLDGAKYANIEQQSIDYVMDCLFGWAKRREASIKQQLIDAPQFYYAEHNLDSLLRGDIESRYMAYSIARQWGWLSVDDIRRRENMNPLGAAAGGNIYLQPLNMYDVSKPRPTTGTAPTPAKAAELDPETKAMLAGLAKELGKTHEFMARMADKEANVLIYNLPEGIKGLPGTETVPVRNERTGLVERYEHRLTVVK